MEFEIVTACDSGSLAEQESDLELSLEKEVHRDEII